MRIFSVASVLFSLAIFVACSSESTSSPSPAADAGGDGAFGCCEAGDSPPSCNIPRTGLKQGAFDNCILGYDGNLPDPNQEGWTKVTDENGCEGWKPPPSTKLICCGCAQSVDAGAD